MSHRLSLSRYALATKCSYWARGDIEFTEEPPGEKARIGTLVHRLVEAHLTPGKKVHEDDVDLHELAQAMEIFSGPLRGWVDAWASGPERRRVELRLRYEVDSDTVKETPRRGEPGYCRPGFREVTGELDFIKDYGTHLEVIDLKTGQKRYTNEEQLRSYAVLASRFWPTKLVRVAFLYARKTKVELTPFVDLDADRLDAEAGDLRVTLLSVPGAEPKRGDHCFTCPLGRSRCPAYARDQSPTLLECESLF